MSCIGRRRLLSRRSYCSIDILAFSVRPVGLNPRVARMRLIRPLGIFPRLFVSVAKMQIAGRRARRSRARRSNAQCAHICVVPAAQHRLVGLFAAHATSSYASSFGASISARKRSNVQGQVIGMPRSSRYQLRQPELQIVVARGLDALGLELLGGRRRDVDLARAAGAEQLDQLLDVAELDLRDLDQREVADRAVRARSA